MSGYSVPDLLVPSPFRQLAALLDGIAPGAEPIDLSIGAPQHPLPDFVAEALGQDLSPLSRYPAITGTPALRQAVADWLNKRFDLHGTIEPGHILPVSGSREGLFYAAFLAKAIGRKSDPAILVPNPGYPTYFGAAKAAGCRLLPFPESQDGLCAPEVFGAAILDQAVAVYVHSPSNPQGSLASHSLWQSWISAARRHSFFLLADECYSELYRTTPPVGVLQAALALGGSNPFERVITFNSLSKRSNIPGLRVGFVAGDPDFMTAFATFRNVAGPQMPEPTQRVAICALSDEAHVADNRRLYNAKFKLAEEILGVSPPEGGFFLWLDCENLGGEATAKRLWAEVGIKSVPGRYLTYREAGLTHSEAGAQQGDCDRYVRLALVAPDLSITREALERVARVVPRTASHGKGRSVHFNTASLATTPAAHKEASA